MHKSLLFLKNLCHLQVFTSICFVLNPSQHHWLSRFCFANVNISSYKHVFNIFVQIFFVTIIIRDEYVFSQIFCVTDIFFTHTQNQNHVLVKIKKKYFWNWNKTKTTNQVPSFCTVTVLQYEGKLCACQ